MRTLIKIFVFCKCSSSQESCGGLVPDGNGLIRSPPSSANPSIYADNLDCRWLLGQELDTIVLEFSDSFAIEQAPSCDWDWLQLTIAGSVGDKYCGDGADLPGSRSVFNGPVEIHFRTDSGIGQSGFEILYEIIPPDPCEGVNCNAGTCERGLCNCPPNFIGQFCESDFNECANGQPCGINGVCINSFGGFECVCESGYSGTRCQENVNECASDPCRNGGTCLDLDGSFQCLCREFFSGELCENTVERIECSSNLCSNKGTCQQTNESPFYRCICEPGAFGEDCSITVGCFERFTGQVVAPLTVVYFNCYGTEFNSSCEENGEWSIPLTCKEKIPSVANLFSLAAACVIAIALVSLYLAFIVLRETWILPSGSEFREVE